MRTKFDQNIQDELYLLGEELKSKFSPDVLQALAYETKMIRRSRKLTVQDLVSLCVFLSQTVCTEPITSLCTKLHEATGTSLTAQGLNNRFNECAVAFFKQLFLRTLRLRFPSCRPLTDRFKRIRILDSTVFQLPASYAQTIKDLEGILQKQEYAFN